MHLQENTLFDLDIWGKVTGNVVQYPLHHVTYAPVKYVREVKAQSPIKLSTTEY